MPRFTLFRRELSGNGGTASIDEFLAALERAFRLEQFIEQLGDLERDPARIRSKATASPARKTQIKDAIGEVFEKLRGEAPALYKPGAERKSDFFRDIAGSLFLSIAEEVAVARKVPVSTFFYMSMTSRSSKWKNRPPAGDMRAKFNTALDRIIRDEPEVTAGDGDVHEPIGRALGGGTGGNLSGRHRLWPGDAPVLEGSHSI